MKDLKSKFAGMFISLFLGAIIISFVLTGFTGFSLDSNKVATVGDTEVSRDEYRRALGARLNQFAQARQGKSLTEKEIRTFGVRERVLDQLINQKLMLNYANELGFDAGKKDIKSAMKEIYPFFFNNGQFDVTRYKGALESNRLSPAEFEEDLIDQTKVITLNKLIGATASSKAFAEDMFKLKNEMAKVLAVSIDKEAMTQNIAIAKKEITDFIKDSKNKATIDSLYKSYQAEKMDQAKELTKVQNELVKKHLQRTKRAELAEFNKKLAADVKELVSKNKISQLTKLSKKYGFKFVNKKEMSVINPSVEGIQFPQDDVTTAFNKKDFKTLITQDNPAQMNILRLVSIKKANPTKEELQKEVEFSQYRTMNTINAEIVKLQKSKDKIVKSAVLQ